MKLRKFTLALLAASIGFAAMGCSGDRSAESTTTGDNDLNSEFGGYTAADEAPAFGDPQLAAAMADEPVYDDPAISADALDSLELGASNVYVLALRWGQLEGDSTVTTPTDWSGSLQLTYGGMAVRHLIRFEPGQDHIVRPRTSRTLLEWVSLTTVHFDGLLLLIVDPVDSNLEQPSNSLVLTLPQYSRTFTMDDLASLEEVVDIDPSGNQLAINAGKLDLVACGAGPIEGVWRLNRSQRGGEFFGRWQSEDGVVGGHVRGHFGTRPDGNRVFFGKAIGWHGRFEGLLRGTWGSDPGDSTAGWFDGVWASRVGLATGTVKGTWQSKTNDDADDAAEDGLPGNRRQHPLWGGGFFSGWWERQCDADSSDNGA